MKKKNYQAPELDIQELLGEVLLSYSNGTSGDCTVKEEYFNEGWN